MFYLGINGNNNFIPFDITQYFKGVKNSLESDIEIPF